MVLKEFIKQLASVIPEERIGFDEAILSGYAADLSSPPGDVILPSAVVLPESVEEVIEVVKLANSLKVPIVPMSRGSNIAGLSVPRRGEVVLDLRLMRGLEINKDAAYAVVEPGVTFHQFSLEIKRAGFMAHLPTASGGSSVLANYLMKPSGCMGAKWDPDPVISLEVVTPAKGVIRTGSAGFGIDSWRSRYGPFPDITGLFACSYGTLGVVTKASVKLFERGECERLLVVAFDSLEPALEFMKRAVRRNLAESVTFWSWVWNIFHTLMCSKDEKIPQEMMKKKQKEPPPGVPFGLASVRLNGYEKVVKAQEEVCVELAESLGGKRLTREELYRIHPGSWDYFYSYFVEGVHPKLGEESTLKEALWLPGWLITAEPKAIKELEEVMWSFAEKEAEPPYMFRVLPFNHAREFFMAFVILIPGDIKDKKEYITHLKKAYSDFYHRFLKSHGAIMFRYRRDPSYFALTGTYGRLLREIKKILDPNNIMNPSVNLF